MTRTEINDAIQHQEEIILDREALLRSKDYVGTKLAMGVAKKSEYEDVIAETQLWRQDIRDAQAEISRLESLEPDPDETPVPIEE